MAIMTIRIAAVLATVFSGIAGACGAWLEASVLFASVVVSDALCGIKNRI